MKNNRRSFLKLTSLAGLSIAGGSIFNSIAAERENISIKLPNGISQGQRFNMTGYGAPRLETVRAGFIGLGSRGPGHVMNLTKLEGVKIAGLCDLVPEEVVKVQKR